MQREAAWEPGRSETTFQHNGGMSRRAPSAVQPRWDGAQAETLQKQDEIFATIKKTETYVFVTFSCITTQMHIKKVIYPGYAEVPYLPNVDCITGVQHVLFDQ